MRRLKLLVVSVLALVSIGAMSASAASATHLFLKTAKRGALAPGTPIFVDMFVFPESPPPSETCGAVLISNGSLSANGAPKDKVAVPPETHSAGCAEGLHSAPIDVALSAIELTKKGKLLMKAQVKIDRFGPCVYELKKVKGTFPLPGSLRGTVHGVVGKKNSLLSNVACSKTQLFEFEFEIQDNETGELLESELRA
jgi:hypothetical protein